MKWMKSTKTDTIIRFKIYLFFVSFIFTIPIRDLEHYFLSILFKIEQVNVWESNICYVTCSRFMNRKLQLISNLLIYVILRITFHFIVFI